MNLEDTFHRRTSDASPMDIEKLIAAEDDPKVRAQLMIMNSINQSVIASTNMTVENTRAMESMNKSFRVHLDNFDAHVKAQDEAKNQIRGAWRVLIGVFGVGQALVLGGISLAWNNITTNQRAITELQINDVRHDSRLGATEQRLTIAEQRVALVDGKLDRK